jgi:hypothetical protein
VVSGDGRRPASGGGEISAGHVLTTVGRESAASLVHASGVRIELGGASVLALPATASGAGAAATDVLLGRGSLRVIGSARPGVAFAVSTPHAAVAVAGSAQRYGLTVTERATRVAVDDGRL